MKKIDSIAELCSCMGISVNFLKYILYVKKDNYITFNVPKKSGGVRTITAPKDELKFIQRQLLCFLEKNYLFLDCQHGFIKGKSCVSNAACHVGKRFVLNGDIENFFDNIHFGRIRGAFLNKPFSFSNEVATTIAKIVSYNKKLPQGAPTSPLISNIICYSMDKRLNYLAKKNNCRYSRYADDITFSTDAESFPKEIAIFKDGKTYFSNKVIGIINGGFGNGFVFNDKKTRLQKRFMRQEVTGIVVNRKTNVNSKYIKNIRAILYNIRKHGYFDTYIKTFGFDDVSEEEARNKLFGFLGGKINYLKMVKGDADSIYLKYANEFNKVFKSETFDITEEIKILKYAKRKCYVIETDYCFGTGFSLEKNKICTSTHIIVNKENMPSFVFNQKNEKYEKQFPIKVSPFVHLLHPNLRNKKFVDVFSITKKDYESDVITLNININNKNKLNLARRKAKVGDVVYMVGYPGFNGFTQSSMQILKAVVTGYNVYFGRKLINTDISPKHGMSGGPVLNTNREVVGIIYAGFDDGSNENVGFISLVE